MEPFDNTRITFTVMYNQVNEKCKAFGFDFLILSVIYIHVHDRKIGWSVFSFVQYTIYLKIAIFLGYALCVLSLALSVDALADISNH